MSRARHVWIQVLQHSAMRCSPSLGPFTPWVGVSPGLLTDTPYPVQQTQPEGRDFSFLSVRVTWVIFVRQSLEPRNLGLTTILLSTPLVPTSLEEAEGHTHGARAHSQWYSRPLLDRYLGLGRHTLLRGLDQGALTLQTPPQLGGWGRAGSLRLILSGPRKTRALILLGGLCQADYSSPALPAGASS